MGWHVTCSPHVDFGGFQIIMNINVLTKLTWIRLLHIPKIKIIMIWYGKGNKKGRKKN